MQRSKRSSKFAVAVACSAFFALVPATAETSKPSLPSGKKSIVLVTHNGKETTIGHVVFVPSGDATKFEVVLDTNVLTDNFLSMRNFQCLQGIKRQWCHLPYPYETHGTIKAGDLTDLEYSLMFLWRTFDRVSADAWNGLYFKLAFGPDGSISGPVNDADFNVMASPPIEKFARPVSYRDLTPVTPGSQEWDKIEIR